jgi:membrane glycosyltransferase
MRPLVTLSRARVAARVVLVAMEPAAVAEVAESAATFAPRGITPQDTVVFVIGMVPFVWATIEFWRRIAVGEPFGTGKDSVIIRDTSGPETLPERRRVLGRDAIITARLLFVAVGLTLGLVALAGYQALNSGSMPLSG